MQRRGPSAHPGKRQRGRLMDRRMGAAAKCRGIETDPRQHPLSCRDMIRLAIVGRTRKRQFLIRQAKPVGRPRFHQNQRLQGFDRRTRVYGPLDIANSERAEAIGIDQRNGAAVTAFDHTAAKNIDKNRILHRSGLHDCAQFNSNVAGF